MNPAAREPRSTGADLSVVSSPDPIRPALVPQDLRLANMRRVVQELRTEPALSRAELARRTGMAVPTVHRLVSDLVTSGLVGEEALPRHDGRLGRPPALYRFHDEAGLVAGVDVGNETTRIALADLGGTITAFYSQPTDTTKKGLVTSLSDGIDKLLRQMDRPLVGVGVGIAAVVHPQTGRLHDPPQHPAWSGVALGAELSERLPCEVGVDQDNHLAAIAECSSAGTAPGADSLVVLQVGKGIGAGYALQGRKVAGAVGRFGRIARWPVAAGSRHLPGSTLGEALPTAGLVRQYHSRGGVGPVTDGSSLALAAREGDRKARAVMRWAAQEIAAVLARVDALLAPDVLVFGGGLSGSFDLLEVDIRAGLPVGADLRASALGDRAVVAGAILTGSAFTTEWLMRQLQRA